MKFDDALRVQRECFGQSHSEVAWSMGSIAKVFMAEKQWAETAELLTKARDLFSATFGDDHKTTVWADKKPQQCPKKKE